MKKFLSENGGMLAVLAVLAVILSAYQEWRIGVAVDAALSEKNFPSDATIAEVNGQINVHTNQIENVEDRQDFQEEQLQDLGRILMRRPDGQ